MKLIRNSVLILLGILLCQACDFEWLATVHYDIMKNGSNRRIDFEIAGYSVRIIPACNWDWPEGSKDSCQVIVSTTMSPGIKDTLIFYPSLGKSRLMIEIFNEPNWKIATGGRFLNSSHFLQLELSECETIDKDVRAVLSIFVKPDHLECYVYDNLQEPPFHPILQFDSRGNRPSNVKKSASLKMLERTICWEYTNMYNYALLSDERGVVTDTLRWSRRSKYWNTWDFLLEGDTIIIDEESSSYPSCSSPLCVRSVMDFREQYDTQGEIFIWEVYREKKEGYYPVTFVRFIDNGGSSKDIIQAMPLYLPSPPSVGKDKKTQFLREQAFLLE